MIEYLEFIFTLSGFGPWEWCNDACARIDLDVHLGMHGDEQSAKADRFEKGACPRARALEVGRARRQ